MAECLTRAQIAAVDNIFSSDNECLSKSEAEGSYQVIATDGATSNELVTAVERTVKQRHLTIRWENTGISADCSNFTVKTSGGTYTVNDNNGNWHYDIPEGATTFSVTSFSATITNRSSLKQETYNLVYQNDTMSWKTADTQTLSAGQSMTLNGTSFTLNFNDTKLEYLLQFEIQSPQ